tara:strand:+ start:552 stop:737 length:186 start_codon:yes stop_codon:yes gene_type:complete
MKIVNRFGRIVSVIKEQGERMIKNKEATLYVEKKKEEKSTGAKNATVKKPTKKKTLTTKKK